MAAPDPLREAFRMRALGAVERMAREAAPEALMAALAAPTDTGTLARATADQAVSEAIQRLEPLAGAIARAADAKARLVERAHGLLSAEAVAKLVGLSRQGVDKRRAQGKLLAVRIRGDWAYPAAQFAEGEVVDGIPEVVAGMTDTTPWAVLSFLLAESDALGDVAPLAALRAGRQDEVLQLVAAREVDAYS
jgi:hypothetical protein